MNNAYLILPDFTLILIGWLLHRATDWSTGFWTGLEKLVYFVLFPALLFISIARVPFAADTAARFLLTGIATTLTGVALGYAAKPFSAADPLSFASGVQCAFRFNSFIALAPAAQIGGATGVALLSLLLGMAVPICNVASVWGLARHGSYNLARELLRNPLVLSTLAGYVFNVLRIPVPEPLAMTLSRLGNASVALGLIAVGAGLRLTGLHAAPRLSAWFISVKLLALPAVAFLLGTLLSLTPLQLQIVVMFAALPSASSSYILATRMGGNGPMVAFIVSATTIGSIVTLPFWLQLVL